MVNRKLESAILLTLTYSDIFEYPLTTREIQRYLVKERATEVEVSDALGAMSNLSHRSGYFALHGKDQLFINREERASASKRLWCKARFWSRLVAHLPYVRMVAITGTLAVDNVSHDADIDYLIVTEPGRLWLCRALILGLDRISRRVGVSLCPNYLITTQALSFPDHSLFTAREVTQMVPVSGRGIYRKIRAENTWVREWLPNAIGDPRPEIDPLHVSGWLRTCLEFPFNNSLGDKVESWEMRRKIKKLVGHNLHGGETRFAANFCKGHFEGHRKRTQIAFENNLIRVQGKAR